MKALFTFALLLILPRLSIAGSCCLAGGPKSFIQMKDLESYQLGLSTSVRDVYGRYDAYGELVRAEKTQTYTVAIGMGAKLFDGMDLSATLPWVYQVKRTGSGNREGASIGDVLLATRLLLLRSLFQDEWYPTIHFHAGLKLPTGNVESISTDGKLQPGTGNGIWEPYLGVSLQKDYHLVIVGLSATYTRRFSRSVLPEGGSSVISVKEGDKFELLESATFPLSQRLSLSAGSTQSWELGREIGGNSISDSSTRVVTAFLSSSYFLTRFWSLSLGWEFAVPIAKIGMNQQAARSLTVTTNYAFF